MSNFFGGPFRRRGSEVDVMGQVEPEGEVGADVYAPAEASGDTDTHTHTHTDTGIGASSLFQRSPFSAPSWTHSAQSEPEPHPAGSVYGEVESAVDPHWQAEEATYTTDPQSADLQSADLQVADLYVPHDPGAAFDAQPEVQPYAHPSTEFAFEPTAPVAASPSSSPFMDVGSSHSGATPLSVEAAVPEQAALEVETQVEAKVEANLVAASEYDAHAHQVPQQKGFQQDTAEAVAQTPKAGLFSGGLFSKRKARAASAAESEHVEGDAVPAQELADLVEPVAGPRVLVEEPDKAGRPLTERPLFDALGAHHRTGGQTNETAPEQAAPEQAAPEQAAPEQAAPTDPAQSAAYAAFANRPSRLSRPVRTSRPSLEDKLAPADGRLVAQGLAKSFGGRKVLRDVSLSVERGEVVGLLGPNGAGKTTSFYIVCGLLKANAGTVTIDGRDVTRKAVYQRARAGLGYLPQEASIFRGLSVEKNILSILETRYRRRRDRREKLEQLLDEFSIQHIRKSPALALSGGERRRVEIARALAADPNFVLLDEPFAGIDPIAVGDIRNLVSQLKNRGIGILITDHNVRETLGVVERAYIIYGGEVLKHGYPDDIINDQNVRDVYLGEQFSL